MAIENKRWIVANHGSGDFNKNDFAYETQTISDLKNGEILVKIVHVSVDPTQLGWSREDTYLPKVPIGDCMRALGVGYVLQSKAKGFSVGDHVSGLTGFQEYFQGNPKLTGLQVIPKFIPMDQALAVFSHIGATSYIGMLEIGQPKEGETVVVTAAAGAVGSLAVQMAKIKGCRVIGICSTSQKAAFVVDECGADVCLTYKHSDGKSKTARELRAELAEACPKGIDIYFENVGGFITEAVFPLFNDFARVAACGMISHYQKDSMKSGPDSNLNLYGSDIVIKRITIKGFICTDYVPKFQAYFTEISKWISAGKLKAKLDVVEGSENCINALAGLFESKNTGKRIVTFCEQPAPGSFYAFLAKLILPKATAAAAVVAAAAVGYQFYQSKL